MAMNNCAETVCDEIDVLQREKGLDDVENRASVRILEKAIGF